MGSPNFANNHLTSYSYQIMGDIESDWLEDLTKEIENEIEKNDSISVYISRCIIMHIAFDILTVEYGYHEGIRLEPKYNIEFEFNEDEYPKWDRLKEEEDDIDIEVTYIPDNIHEMVINNNWTSYREVLWDCIDSNTTHPIIMKKLEKARKKIDKYFNQIEDIILKYTTPYTTGYSSSSIDKKDLK